MGDKSKPGPSGSKDRILEPMRNREPEEDEKLQSALMRAVIFSSTISAVESAPSGSTDQEKGKLVQESVKQSLRAAAEYAEDFKEHDAAVQAAATRPPRTRKTRPKMWPSAAERGRRIRARGGAGRSLSCSCPDFTASTSLQGQQGQQVQQGQQGQQNSPSLQSYPTYPGYPAYQNFPNLVPCPHHVSYANYASCAGYSTYANYPNYSSYENQMRGQPSGEANRGGNQGTQGNQCTWGPPCGPYCSHGNVWVWDLPNPSGRGRSPRGNSSTQTRSRTFNRRGNQDENNE